MKEDQNDKYKFSIVLPIVNKEDTNFIELSIQSVVNQTIGFKDNIQLIIQDASGIPSIKEICEKYKDMYSGNVEYIESKSKNLADIFNDSIKYLKGKYTNFMNPYDKWGRVAFENIYSFIENNEDDIDFIRADIKYIKNDNDKEIIKSKVRKIINLEETPGVTDIGFRRLVGKTDILRNYKFDNSLNIHTGELFNIKIILSNPTYGILDDAIYYARESNSLKDQIYNEEYFYELHTMLLPKIIQISKNENNKLPMYVQSIVARMIKDTLGKTKYYNRIEKKCKNEIYGEILKSVKYISDEALFNQSKFYSEFKYHILRLRDGANFYNNITYDTGVIYYKNYILCKIFKNRFELNDFEIKKGKIHIQGFLKLCIPKDDFEIYVSINKKEIKMDLIDFKMYNRSGIDGQNLINAYGFKFDIPISKKTKIRKIKFLIKYKNYDLKKMKIKFGEFSRLSQIKNAYYSSHRFIVKTHDNCLFFRPNTLRNRMKAEFKFDLTFIKKFRFKLLFYRILYFILNRKKKREIWLVSDRTNAANDNGIHLFKYLNKNGRKDVDYYFVISKDVKDYEEVKKYGKVIDFGSLKYKMYFLLADNIISSQMNEAVMNPFGNKYKHMYGLYRANMVFLQHGIIKDDLSSWLNSYRKNLKIFVTSAQPEYDSIVNGNYNFKGDVVKLTGLPRYDNLKDKSEKIIAFMPTWRNNLTGKDDTANGVKGYNEHFKESLYYNFYNDLINDERLLKVMRENGYKGRFVIHPCHIANAGDFVSNDVIEVETGAADYQQIFNTSKLLISDYSSVVFDFAYLRKPSLYTQFDREEFFSNHTYDVGYFDYERDGMGPVYYNYEDTLKEIIRQIENDCKIEQKYIDRINKFYKYHDQDNCKRVYEEILNLEK